MPSKIIKISALNYADLNQKLENIQLAYLAINLKISIQTTGWPICGWRIKTKGDDITLECKMNCIDAISIRQSENFEANFSQFYISPGQEYIYTNEDQFLEINWESTRDIKIIEIRAYDRISIWNLLHLVRKDISSHHSMRIGDWVMDGRKEMNILDQDATVINHLNALNTENAKPHFQNYIWNARPDVQNACKIIISPSFNTWFETHGKNEHDLHDLTENGELPLKLMNIKSYQERPFGVNLMGYESSALGIGEDLRTCKEALNSAGVPTKIIDIPTTHTSEELRRQARETSDQIAPYAFNLICMTAEEHARIFLELGYSIFSERYNIGYWPWELANWPDPWKPLFGLVDEVWASSRFTYNALKNNLNHTKIPKLMYMPLGVSPIKPLSIQKKISVRKTFDLSQNSFLVICSFDGRSSFFRKNPWGSINAFQKAFPTESNASVTLIIKTMNATVDKTEWEKLKKITEFDNRIKLIDKKLSREEIVTLYGCCDTLISLHRAEGFGRILAESLILGLNVVATNYSGNTDFCNGPNFYSIDYDLTSVTEGEYVHSKNQFWAEPSIDHAASILHKLYINHETSKKTNRNKLFQEILQAKHNKLSTSIVGFNYKNRIVQIWNNSKNNMQKELRWNHAGCLYEIKDQ